MARLACGPRKPGRSSEREEAMTTRGCADVVFCLDSSGSMEPCFKEVQDHLGDFVAGLESRGQTAWDLRVDFVSYFTVGGPVCAPDGTGFSHVSVFHDNLWEALYVGGQTKANLFTKDLSQFKDRLTSLSTGGDESPLVALDFALDFPWRPASTCHRAVVLMTDEPLEDGWWVEEQVRVMPKLTKKIQDLRVLLYLVAPDSPGFQELAKVDKSEYDVADFSESGLMGLDFKVVMASIGKSVSAPSRQADAGVKVERGLFGQARWKM